MGFSAALGGLYAMLYLKVLLSIIITLGLLLWGLRRFIKARRGTPLKPLSDWKRLIVVLLSLDPIFMSVTYLEILYSGYKEDQARDAEVRRRNIELTQTTSFGEINIMAGSLINRGDPQQFMALLQSDPLLDLGSVRFTQVTPIAGAYVYAMGVDSGGVTLELAKDYQLQTPEGPTVCPAGNMLIIPYPNRTIEYEERFKPPYNWFTPSKWQSRSCHRSSYGVMVMHVNQHGIYFPKFYQPYVPKEAIH